MNLQSLKTISNQAPKHEVSSWEGRGSPPTHRGRLPWRPSAFAHRSASESEPPLTQSTAPCTQRRIGGAVEVVAPRRSPPPPQVLQFRPAVVSSPLPASVELPLPHPYLHLCRSRSRRRHARNCRNCSSPQAELPLYRPSSRLPRLRSLAGLCTGTNFWSPVGDRFLDGALST